LRLAAQVAEAALVPSGLMQSLPQAATAVQAQHQALPDHLLPAPVVALAVIAEAAVEQVALVVAATLDQQAQRTQVAEAVASPATLPERVALAAAAL
jgi:hypothetical protein